MELKHLQQGTTHLLSYEARASSQRPSFSYHPSLSAPPSACRATHDRIPTAASGWRSWLLMWISASTAVAGEVWNSISCCT